MRKIQHCHHLTKSQGFRLQEITKTHQRRGLPIDRISQSSIVGWLIDKEYERLQTSRPTDPDDGEPLSQDEIMTILANTDADVK